MHNSNTDLIFPPRSIPFLGNERGAAWQELVTDVERAGSDSLEQMAFILMMVRLNNCATCGADSYRAIQGCTVCTRQTLKRFHGSDEELIRLFKTAVAEVNMFLQKKHLTILPLDSQYNILNHNKTKR